MQMAASQSNSLEVAIIKKSVVFYGVRAFHSVFVYSVPLDRAPLERATIKNMDGRSVNIFKVHTSLRDSINDDFFWVLYF